MPLANDIFNYDDLILKPSIGERSTLNDYVERKTLYVALTFDDGYSSHYNIAKYLSAIGIHATFFVATHLKDKCYLASAPKKIIEIGDLGHEIGSHTCTHPKLQLLPQSEIEYELRESKKWLEDLLGANIQSFAYPYFLYNENILKQTHKHYTISRSRDLHVGSGQVRSVSARFLNLKNMMFTLKDFFIEKNNDYALTVLHNVRLAKVALLLAFLKALAVKPTSQITFVTISELACILDTRDQLLPTTEGLSPVGDCIHNCARRAL